MKVEDVSRVGFASGRTSEQQRHLAIGPRVLGEVVVNDERVFALVHEELGHGAPGIRREVLQGSGVRRVGGNDDGVLHRALLLQHRHRLCDLAGLLSDGDVYADQVSAALIDDGVQRDRGLPGRTVADDQLALSPADRDHRVDGLDAGLDGGIDRHAGRNVRGDNLDWLRVRGTGRPLAVDRLTERVDDAGQ